MDPDDHELQSRMREAELMWSLIAHERVKERLDRLFFTGAFAPAFRTPQDEVVGPTPVKLVSY